ncbi:uncharacterized protein METZ01_LOCUS72250, partial [marine metagenome]
VTTRWGILATGRIAKTLADAVVASETGKLVAIGSRTLASANAFASNYDGLTAHGSYQELVDDPNVDALYIATPHPQHAEWTIKSLDAGKAVLCEKPMAVNHPQVMAMVQKASDTETFLMEAFMYRTHPQTQQFIKLVRDGAIGEIRHIQASFGFHTPFNAEHRLFANDLAGGGIMDVGCYPVSMARLIVGEEPERVTGHGRLGETQTDAFASALLHFPTGIAAQVATGVQLGLDNSVSVFGSSGRIHIDQPWLCPTEWSFELIQGNERQTIAGSAKPAYIQEVDEVDRCLSLGLTESTTMDWRDSSANARVLDAWRHAIGLEFDLEKPHRQINPIHGRPLQTESSKMVYDQVDGVDKPVSRLVMGCDNQPNAAHAFVMFDDFYEAGGNTFDTAYIYGGGAMERFLGHWIANRGLRNEVVVIGKGAHTPFNHPIHVPTQLNESLERLQTDHLDLYFLHRDNPDVEVGEWIEVLNQEHETGRFHAFGASNWSLARVQAANDYAAQHGLQGFVAVSNNFSLAEMIDPVWPGCIAATSPAFAKYLESNQLALFPWSSQARGFFTARADTIQRQLESDIDTSFGSQPTNAEMQRCWFSDDNWKRRDRATELASAYDVELINVALAYVLKQPFPCFPLIGPRQLSETRSSLQALSVNLSDEERQWLNLELPRRPAS